MSHIPTATDVVFVETLRVSANIGPDCWGKKRDQPIHVTVYLHLKPSFLKAAGESDDVLDSVHYGHLTKAISGLVKAKAEFDGVDGLVEDVAEEAFELGGESRVGAVRVVVEAPKLVLLARSFVVDATVSAPPRKRLDAKTVTVSELIIPVIIGVNSAEREAKQRVETDIIFYEKEGARISHVEYQRVVDQLSNEIEASCYLTLEKFVHEVARTACLALEGVDAITVQAKKSSALSFAEYSGVEITRRSAEFVRGLYSS